MKTSNYIVCTFFAFFIGSFFLLFICAKKHDNFIKENNATMNCELEDFAVVVIQAKERLYIKNGDTCKLEFNYLKNNEIPETSYRQCNDTLFINNIPAEAKLYARRLEVIEANEGSNFNIEINSAASENFRINANHAKITCWWNRRITNLHLEAVHSEIHLENIDTLSARLIDNSSLYCSGNSNKVAIERDSTSWYRSY